MRDRNTAIHKVKASYPHGVEASFFQCGPELAEFHARLVHPQQKKPEKLDIQPAPVDGSWHFYSVQFNYSAPDTARPKSIHGVGIHVSFSYDEEEASKRLCAAINTVVVAAFRAQIRHLSEYVWPDGSLYYLFASCLPEEEFKATELLRFEEELEQVSMNPFKLVRHYKDGEKKRSFTHSYGESRVKVSRVREELNPLRRDSGKGSLHLVDLFNGVSYDGHLSFKYDETLQVPEKEAESFQGGFEVAYGHQNLFTPWADDRRSPEEVGIFAWGYYLAKFLQLLTE